VSPILLSRLEIDDERWNNAITASGQNTIYALSWYLDVVCEDWNAIVWPSKSDYRVVLPLPIKIKWGIRVVQQPLFCQYLGFFYKNKISSELLSEFLKLIDSGFLYISSYAFSPFNYHVINDIIPDFVRLKSGKRSTTWIDLNRPYQQIRQRYNRDRNVNLKRSQQEKWHVEQSEDLSPLIKLFKENHAGKIRGGVDERAYYMLGRLVEKICLNANSELWYAVRGSQTVAGVLIVRSGNFAVYLFNAANDQGRKGNARSLLLDKYLARNAEQDIVFDFESPEVASVISFYRSFGGEENPFISICKNELPFPFKQIQILRKRLLRSFGRGESEEKVKSEN